MSKIKTIISFGVFFIFTTIACSLFSQPIEIPTSSTLRPPQGLMVTSTPLPSSPTTTSTTTQTPTFTSTRASTKTPTSTSFPTQTRTSTPDEPDPEVVITTKANEVMLALKILDLDTFSTFVHPTLGVRFSPYAYVHDSDLVFSAGQVEGLLADKSKYLWGYSDGSGLPINLTFKEYYDRFIYDEDFANADEASFNERLGLGNMIDNSMDFYPESNIVEFHFPGLDPDLYGMDWRSLLLVFQKEDDTWYLVGIIHSEWTS